MLRLVMLLSLVGLLLAPHRTADAQEAIRVLDTHVAADFPLSITFHLEAQGPIAISKAEVRFQVEKQSCAQAESSGFAEFAPATDISTQWTLDMLKGGSFPPGAVVRYHWRLQDESGEVVETSEERYQVVDNRYQWQTIARDILTLSWYMGDQAFGNALMDAAQEALDRLEASTGARPLKPVRLFVYGSTEDLQGSLVFPQEWTGGVSFTEFNIVAIGIPPGSLTWGQRAMAHELTHVVVGQVTFNCFRDIPTWLSEGLATYNEDASGEPSLAYASALRNAIRAGRLLSVRSLGGGFPTAPEEALLAYGESFSLVQYLTERYGAEKQGMLLAMFRSGTTADAALQQVYGFDQRSLEEEWRRYIGAPPMAEGLPGSTPTPVTSAIPTFEPYALSTPTPFAESPGLEATPTPTETEKPAPEHQPTGGGCSGGLPLSGNAGNQELGAAVLPLGLLALAGVALGIRRRNQ
ncbi:peptidase MA family metallohydrolase [Chloroflexota bacterium]